MIAGPRTETMIDATRIIALGSTSPLSPAQVLDESSPEWEDLVISPPLIPDVPLALLPCIEQMAEASDSISPQEMAQEPLPSPQMKGAVVEDAPDDSLACGEAATTPTAISAQALPPVESATPSAPELELCHSGQEHEATTTTSDSDASPEPRLAKEQVDCKRETEKEGEQEEEEGRRRPRRRTRRAVVRANRAARLLQEEEERMQKEEEERKQKEEEKEKEKQDEDTDGKEEEEKEDEAEVEQAEEEAASVLTSATITTTTTASDPDEADVAPHPTTKREDQPGAMASKEEEQGNEENDKELPRQKWWWKPHTDVRAAKVTQLSQEEESKAAEAEESGTPTSPVLKQAYPSVSIEEVEEDHGLTASRWAPKEGVKEKEDKAELSVSDAPVPGKEDKPEAEKQLEKKETGISASRWAPEPEAEAEASNKETGLNASSCSSDPEEEEEDGEGPGVGASRWAPKSEGGAEVVEESKEQTKSKWHLKRLRRRENRRSHVPGPSKVTAPTPDWLPVCRASPPETLGRSEGKRKVPAIVEGRPRMSYLPGEPGEPLVAPHWSPHWRTRKWQRQPI